MTFERFRHTIVLAALVVLALSVSGCAGGAGWGATLAIVTSLTMLFAAGCSEAHSGSEDAGVVATDAGDPPPTFDAGEGNWERCCVDGTIDSCFCPAGAACNYGWFTDCGGGTCSYEPEGCGPDAGPEDAGVDAGAEDAGVDAGVDAGLEGTWENCCVDGMIDTCFCPAGAVCNYGWYNDCGDGTCTDPSTMCPAP